MKTFIIINGTKMYLRSFKDMDAARSWAVNYCNHSLEVIVREINQIE